MILGIHHTALYVPSMQDALDFYCGVLGFEIVMEADLPTGVMEEPFGIEEAGCKMRKIKKGTSHIELFEFGPDAPKGDPKRPVNQHGITHIALASTNVPEDYEMLRAAGVGFNTPPQGETPYQWCYGRDPFGNVIELFETPAEG
jgi:catechol 2,3-dioxygenase-like lactoylglutathione lyase family enzyme